MHTSDTLNDLLALLEGSLKVEDGKAKIVDAAKLRKNIHKLAEISVLGSATRQGTARYLTRLTALAVGVNASIDP